MASSESTSSNSASHNIVWVGRLTGPKGDIARHLAYQIAPLFPALRFQLVGGPSLPDDWPTPPDNVEFVGQTRDVSAYYQHADLVIGAGRVALEAMALGRAVMAIGEACYIGLINEQTIDQAKATNFGDCFSPAFIDWPALERDLSDFSVGRCSLDTSAYSRYLQDYRLPRVNQQVNLAYRQAIAEASLRHLTEVPILMYHQVSDTEITDSVHKVYVSKARLREQFVSLKKRGYQAITFKELADGVRVKKPVILTFDDGYANNYHNLLPLLAEFDFKAVIYALTDEALTCNRWDLASGEPEAALMNREQLLACHRSGRVEIGSHGINHQRLSQLDPAEMVREVVESKQRLESWLEDEVVSFAYPYGDYGDREVEAVRAAGYLFGIATVTGPLHPADDFYRIRRVNLRPKDHGISFWKKTSGWYLRYCRLLGKDF
jgi:peptidoglycan/xylan/chitin deacetylase (PgdA/CDA1 family)